MKLRDIRAIPTLKGMHVLVRAALNVPLNKEGAVANDFRLERALPTLKFLENAGAKTIIIGHIGRDPTDSLLPVYTYLSKKLKLTFVPDILGSAAEEAVGSMHEGDIIMLENLRQKDGEYENDASFAKRLSTFADIYVNDAFAASHRSHASIVGIVEYLPSYAGILLQEEIAALSEALHPASPSLFILGGAKFQTKEPLIRKFLQIYDTVFVGGALANDFFKAQGLNVGVSRTSDADGSLKELLELGSVRLPEDVTVKTAGGKVVKKPAEVEDNESILDSGPQTVETLGKMVDESAFVLWNGPLGDYEQGFVEQTESLAKRLSMYKKQCIVGGGDTVAAIARLGLMDKYTFVSTGGGAMLKFLLEGTLPGIEALRANASIGD